MLDVMLFIAIGDVNGKYMRGDVIDIIQFNEQIQLSQETLEYPTWVTVIVTLDSTVIDALLSEGVTVRRRYIINSIPQDLLGSILGNPNVVHDLRTLNIDWTKYISIKAGE